MGLEVSGRGGDSMVFFRSNERVHHDLAIAKLDSDAPGPEQDQVGLYHFAYEFESFDEIREAYRMTQEMGVRIAGFGDHGESKGLYILDPDGVEIELSAYAPELKDTPLEQLLAQGSAEAVRAG